MTDQQQQQQQQQGTYNREEEYLAAQRAANESIDIGRATLVQAQQQHEQLDRASAIADETNYTLDKAGRVLRGMTWSGWVANTFSRAPAQQQIGGGTVNPAGINLAQKRRPPPDVYEDVPPMCRDAAQSVQNYHANVKILVSSNACEAEQRETLQMICDDMFRVARQAVEKLPEAYRVEFMSDLVTLRGRQRPGMPFDEEDGALSKNINSSQSQSLTTATSASLTTPPRSTAPQLKFSPADTAVHKQQEDHLTHISQSLGELGNLAQNLQMSLHQQNEVADRLDNQSESILEKTQMVTRRADRIIQNKSWTPTKATLDRVVSIRHVASGQYLSIGDGTGSKKTTVELVPMFHPSRCVFGLWKRQGEIFGLRNKDSQKWLGQNLFGSLSCGNGSFGRREEWEANFVESNRKSDGGNDDNDNNDEDNSDWKATRLVCASAGWGAGGYLLVHTTTSGGGQPPQYTVQVGGCGVEERKKADVWSVTEVMS